VPPHSTHVASVMEVGSEAILKHRLR